MKNGRINLEWVKRPAILVTVLGTVVIAIIWWFAWMQPQASKLSSIRSQQNLAGEEVNLLQAQIAQLRSESSLLKKELPYLHFFQGQIPPLPEQGQLTAQLYNLSLKTKTFISSLSDNAVNSPATTTAGYSPMPISIQLTGTHNGVVAFLKGLYTLPRLVTIQAVNLSPPSQQSNLNRNGTTNGFAAAITATAYTTYVPVAPAALPTKTVS